MSDEFSMTQEYENAKARLTEQQNTLEVFSHEGQRMVRIAIVSSSVIVASVGAFGLENLQSLGSLYFENCSVELIGTCILSTHAVAGIAGVLFFLSMFMHAHAMGFEARGIHNLTNPKEAYEYSLEPVDTESYLQSKLGKYSDRINHNDRVIHSLETFLALGKLMLVTSLIFLSVLLYNWILGSPLGAIGIIVGGVLYSVLLIYQDRIRPDSTRSADGLLSTVYFRPLYGSDYKEDSESQ